MKSAQCATQTSQERKSTTILVVEDEALVRMVIADYLRECGYRVIEAATADEALAILKAESRIQILFSDIEMPGELNGFGLARWAREHRPDLAVLLTSGRSQAANAAEELCDSGPLIAKPYTAEDVMMHISSLLQKALKS